MNNAFLKKVLSFIRKHHLLSPGQKILIGVSGGADSLALLHTFARLRVRLSLHCVVGHVDHQLRKNSKADARFVEKNCQRLNIPFYGCKVKIRRVTGKSSLEERAREARYNALAKLARQQNADALALAHQRDDLAETVLMRILRGSGLEGLQAIVPQRDIQGVRLIRPFLAVSRKDVEIFLRENNIRPRRDPTNEKMDFTRNRIRRQLLPFLEKHYQPQIRRILAQLAQTAAADYNFLDNEAKKTFAKCLCRPAQPGRIALRLAHLKRYPESMLRMVLRESFARIKGNKRQLSLTHVEEMLDLIRHRPSEALVHLPSGIQAQKKKNALILAERKSC